jgi:hypothetical protein
MRRKWVIVARRAVKQPNGELAVRLRVQCACGYVRTMSLAEWRNTRSLQCNRCRMRDEHKYRKCDGW